LDPIINIVLPIFAIVGAGYLSGRFGVLGEDSSSSLNAFVYWVALPALLFRAMAIVDLERVFDTSFLLAFLIPLVALWFAAIVVARLFFRRSLAEATVHGMNGVYGNSGYMGIPLAVSAYGDTAAVPAIVATVINTAVVVGIALTLIEVDRKESGGLGSLLGTLFRRLSRNPMLVAPALGLCYAFTGLDLPEPVERFSQILGSAAGPCALFAIGLFMVGKPQSQGKFEVGVMVALKLVGQPLLTALMVFLVFPIDPLSGKVAVLMAALPTGAGSFVLAQAYGIYVLRTSSAILASTVASVLTISAFFIMFPPLG
jgi:malonate transporter